MDSIDRFKDEVKHLNLSNWVIENLHPILKETFGSDDILHIVNGLESIINVVINNGTGPGGFIEAVLKNELKDAILLADNVNIIAIAIYVEFINQYVPLDIILRFQKLKVGGNIVSSHLSDEEIHELVNMVPEERAVISLYEHVITCQKCKDRLIEMEKFYKDIYGGTDEETGD